MTGESTAAVYCRISRDRFGAGLGVERQEAECRALADQRGWHVATIYVDNDLSAYSGKPRPRYEQLLADLAAGRINVVVTWHMDRLHRAPLELERYIGICDPLGIPTHTVRAGELDLSTATGRMHARITGAVARHESEQKGERVRSEKAQAQAAGRWLGGRRPFGFAPDGYTLRPTVEQLVPIFRRAEDLYNQEMPPEDELNRLATLYTAEADAIADATRRALAGESLRTLFIEWNAKGLKTSTGQSWNGSRIRQVLLRPRNAGLTGRTRGAKGNVQVIGKAKWPAIVDKDTWNALRIKLTDPTRRSNRGNVSRRLIGSFLYVCGECGQRLTSGGNRTKDGAGRYACPAQHLARAASPIDDRVLALVEGILRKSGIKLLPTPPDLAPLHAKVDALRARADEIATLLADPESGMTAAQFKAANERNKQKLEQVNAQIATLTPNDVFADVADAEDPVAAFRAAGIDRQRAIIDALMTVTVLRAKPGRQPGGGYFDDESVRIDWKSNQDSLTPDKTGYPE